MTTIAIEITDEQMVALKERADSLGMTPEEWIRSALVERLTQPLSEDARARKVEELKSQLFRERAEVYRALAEGAP